MISWYNQPADDWLADSDRWKRQMYAHISQPDSEKSHSESKIAYLYWTHWEMSSSLINYPNDSTNTLSPILKLKLQEHIYILTTLLLAKIINPADQQINDFSNIYENQ